jgi:hypothetical protein
MDQRRARCPDDRPRCGFRARWRTSDRRAAAPLDMPVRTPHREGAQVSQPSVEGATTPPKEICIMNFKMDRRTALTSGASLAAVSIVPAWAQAKPTLRFAAVFSDKDIRAEMMQMFAKELESEYKVEPYLNSTLFKQGTELVALQRDNLEMGNIAPQDFSKQIPAWSILTSAYLFRDPEHLNKFFASEAGAQMKKMVEDQVKVDHSIPVLDKE